MKYFPKITRIQKIIFTKKEENSRLRCNFRWKNRRRRKRGQVRAGRLRWLRNYVRWNTRCLPWRKNSRGRAGKNICRFRKRRRLLSYMSKDMDKTTVKRLSCITLIIMGFGGLLLAVSEICGGFLPDIAVRIIGIADIICLTLFVFLFVLVSRK